MDINKFNGRCKSLAELRHEARLKYFVLPHKAKLYSPKDDNEVSVVTPIPILGENNNSRWYRNRFSSKPLIPNVVDRMATPPNKQSNTKVQTMQKAAMKCLLGIKSHYSTRKRQCFEKFSEGNH